MNMAPPLTTIVSYCTNEYRFIRACVASVAPFSRQVIVPVADHFFDGTPEDQALLERTKRENPEASFVSYPWIPGRKPRYWHNYSRAVGTQHLADDVEWVLFLDADEIVDTRPFVEFASTLTTSSADAYTLANYWYFREPTYRATTLEESVVLVRRPLVDQIDLKAKRERGQFVGATTPRRVTWRGQPMVHHYSWVRTKAEMLRKVRSWGHRDKKDWVTLVEEEFSRPFNGRCFVHNYQFDVVEDFLRLATAPSERDRR
jgi:hypothetical protein